MRLRALLFLCFVLTGQLNAQRTCSIRPSTEPDVGGPVYPACATDRQARVRTLTPPPRFPEMFRAAGISLVTDPVVLLIIDSTGVPVPASIKVAPSQNHPAFQGVINRAVQQWRFEPAIRDGRPVATFDSIRLRFPPPPPPFTPRDCVDCDRQLYAAQLRVNEARTRGVTCAAALAYVGLEEAKDSTAAAFDEIPHCPSASDAAVLALRMERSVWARSTMRPFWLTLAGRVRSPEVFEVAIEMARGGRRSAFRVLALQTGMHWTRIADSLPARWNERDAKPRTSCGPLRVEPVSPTDPPIAIDSALVRRVIALADSIIGTAGASAELKTTAWCTAEQLR